METSSGKGSGMDPVANTTSFDVVIIGAGIVGAAAFRELCKYDLKVLLLDSLHDVGGDASRANSAILHGGFDPQPGTLMSISTNRVFSSGSSGRRIFPLMWNGQAHWCLPSMMLT